MSTDDPLRYRPFLPGEEPRPSRQQLLLQALRAIASGQAAQERAAEEKAAAQRAVNCADRAPDSVFSAAAERYYGRLELEAQLLLQIDRAQLLRDAAQRKKRDAARVLQRAREALGAERFDAAIAESRRRRGKR